MFALIGYGLLGLVVAVGVVSLLVLVLPSDHLAAAPRDVVPSGLPARPEIGSADVARVRLPVTLRGYRMVDTDAVLDRLAFELERRDQEIDNLRQRAGLPPRPTPEPPTSVSPPESVGDGGGNGDDEVLLPVDASASPDLGVPPTSRAVESPNDVTRAQPDYAGGGSAPGGPTAMGAPVPGSTVPGSTVPGSTRPESTLRASTASGSTMPASTAGGSTDAAPR